MSPSSTRFVSSWGHMSVQRAGTGSLMAGNQAPLHRGSPTGTQHAKPCQPSLGLLLSNAGTLQGKEEPDHRL